MPFYVHFVGVDIRCDTAAEAMALAERAAGNSNGADRRAKRYQTAPSPEAPGIRHRRELAKRSVKFLVALRDAGEKGTGGEKLARAVGCDGASGLGTVVQNTRRLLTDSGVDLKGAAIKKRVGDQKVWFAGPGIGGAIEWLQKMES